MKKPFLFISALLFTVLSKAQVITLDVGHFISKPGAISAFGDTELSYNQRLTSDINDAMQSSGLKTKVQGMDGKLESLGLRASMANGSNLLMSIHHDSVQEYDLTPWVVNGKNLRYTTKAEGFSIFVSEENPRYQESLFCARKLASRLIDAGFQPNYYHHYHNPRGNFKLLYNDMPVYNFNKLAVLRGSKVPAILVEAGVILNPKDAQSFFDINIRKRFAIASSYAIKECLR